MTTYDNLPVYKESYDLLLELFRYTKEFSRDYKYTLGENIKKEVVEMITHIYKANSSIEKRAERIQCARENILPRPGLGRGSETPLRFGGKGRRAAGAKRRRKKDQN